MTLQLRNHIPLAGPATREPCDGTESPMRVSLGFTPKWYRDRLGTDFGEPWHLDPVYRYDQSLLMRELLSALFPQVQYFRSRPVRCPVVSPAESGNKGTLYVPECATISSVFGIMLVSSCYGIPLAYNDSAWPDAEGGARLSREEIQDIITRGPFDVSRPESMPKGAPTLRALYSQMDEIEKRWGTVHGYLNYQGILNVALKVRGNDLFLDMMDDPDFTHAFLGHIAGTIGTLASTVQARQRASGFPVNLLSMSNCVMSMVSPAQYEEFVLPLDRELSLRPPRFGVHTCNWVIDPYLRSLRGIEKMGYIDTGLDSDLARVKELFPESRRAVLYTPGLAESATEAAIAADLERVAREYAPCDIVLADVETTTPESRIRYFLDCARELEKMVPRE